MSLVDNLFERPPVRFADRLERAVSGIADTEQISHLITLGNGENGSRFVLIPPCPPFSDNLRQCVGESSVVAARRAYRHIPNSL